MLKWCHRDNAAAAKRQQRRSNASRCASQQKYLMPRRARCLKQRSGIVAVFVVVTSAL